MIDIFNLFYCEFRKNDFNSRYLGCDKQISHRIKIKEFQTYIIG